MWNGIIRGQPYQRPHYLILSMKGYVKWSDRRAALAITTTLPHSVHERLRKWNNRGAAISTTTTLPHSVHERLRKWSACLKVSMFQGLISCFTRTICKQCMYGTFGREIIIHTVVCGLYIRFWLTLVTSIWTAQGLKDAACSGLPSIYILNSQSYP